jgi:hypothetical protein
VRSKKDKGGGLSVFIPTLRKSAKDGAPVLLWLVGEEQRQQQKQKRNAGVLRSAQNDKQKTEKNDKIDQKDTIGG